VVVIHCCALLFVVVIVIVIVVVVVVVVVVVLVIRRCRRSSSSVVHRLSSSDHMKESWCSRLDTVHTKAAFDFQILQLDFMSNLPFVYKVSHRPSPSVVGRRH
jgi:uncharacterized membrane protein YqiK